ncbi:hypothetical protein [Paramicrobacterium agarici]|uniref:hypothetical protein n=1 Tax=Paramicrobacterium agarici TaxID=630514 RepID=UPI00114F859E|nr:hypothetical protein [Microbacterium agarici]
MPTSITIRSVPEDVRDELARRASLAGQSLQEFLSSELRALTSRPSSADAIARARQRARSYPALTGAEILSDLDADRR